jgi:hypothetical protein
MRTALADTRKHILGMVNIPGRRMAERHRADVRGPSGKGRSVTEHKANDAAFNSMKSKRNNRNAELNSKSFTIMARMYS